MGLFYGPEVGVAGLGKRTEVMQLSSSAGITGISPIVARGMAAFNRTGPLAVIQEANIYSRAECSG